MLLPMKKMKKQSKRKLADSKPLTVAQFRAYEGSSDKRFEAIDKRFDIVDKRFEAIDKRFDTVDADSKSLRHDMGVMMESFAGQLMEYMDKKTEDMKQYFDLVSEQNRRDVFDVHADQLAGHEQRITALEARA